MNLPLASRARRSNQSVQFKFSRTQYTRARAKATAEMDITRIYDHVGSIARQPRDKRIITRTSSMNERSPKSHEQIAFSTIAIQVLLYLACMVRNIV